MAPRIPIFNMFGPSPLQPLEKHIDLAFNAVKKLMPLLDEAIHQQWDKVEKQYIAISKEENKADAIKHDIRSHLHKDLFLPVPRSELLATIMLQDRIANKAKDIAGLILTRQIIFPEAIIQTYRDLLQASTDACSKVRKAINELDDLLEAGFRGSEVKYVEALLKEVDEEEDKADQVLLSIRKQIFTFEKDLPPIDCMFLYKIVEWTGDLADHAQTVGGQLQILLAH